MRESGGIGRVDNTRPMLLRDVVKANRAAGGHFFDADTMKYNGQRQRDFRVKNIVTVSGVRRVFVWAIRGQDRYRHDKSLIMYEFNHDTRGLKSVDTSGFNFHEPYELDRFFEDIRYEQDKKYKP